jgi:hypothetical protein
MRIQLTTIYTTTKTNRLIQRDRRERKRNIIEGALAVLHDYL